MASAGLHEYYINLILGHLRGKKLDANAFNKEIFKLKKTRTAADYLDIGIGPDECRYSIQQAEEITKILTKAL